MTRISRRRLLGTAIATPLALSAAPPLFAQGQEITISHYFTGELGRQAFNAQIDRFEAATGYTLRDSPVGHEDYKTDILVRASGNSLPDVFSYWAGARVQFFNRLAASTTFLIFSSWDDLLQTLAFAKPAPRPP